MTRTHIRPFNEDNTEGYTTDEIEQLNDRFQRAVQERGWSVLGNSVVRVQMSEYKHLQDKVQTLFDTEVA